jgi:spermidine/putrescine transport system substrate-binding protein
MVSQSVTRRTFIKRSGLGAAGLAAGGLLAACGGSSGSSTSAGASASSAATKTGPLGQVTGIVWKGYDSPQAFGPLAKQGLKPSWQYISASNNEIITKLEGGAEGTIDVVTPGEVFLPAMVDAKLLEPLDLNRIPNVQRLFPQFMHPTWAEVNGQTYGVPIAFGSFPVNSRPDIVPGLLQTYSQLADPQYKGKLVTVDDPQNMYVLLKELLGTPDFSKLTKPQLAEAEALFTKIRPNLVTIAASYGDVIDIMARGDAGLCIFGYGFVQIALEQRGIKCTNYNPTKIGGLTGCDVYCIAAQAPNLPGSYAVLNAAISAYGNAFMNSFQDTGVTNPGSVTYLPKNQVGLFPYNDLETYFVKNPFWTSPPPVTSGNYASQTDVINTWEALKTA